ncbi:hypothetical protein O3G_MSEX005055 [Manduca sexta]|uniref:Transposase n=1 Tax=Manduca sexta TaxID=7130 RepID=A0A921YXC6_MANSE|nr:hypothetical protein O3G_MSEX005055 [Manduca sexta]
MLNQIIICDEKWILYDYRKRLSQWLNPGQPTKSYPKPKLTLKKILVSVWWSSAGVVYYSCLKSGQTIKSDIYCQQLQTMMEKLAANCFRSLLLQNKTRPHTIGMPATLTVIPVPYSNRIPLVPLFG